jgi:hypothetical protein
VVAKYAKCIGRNVQEAPKIFDAVRFGALLENVSYDPVTGGRGRWDGAAQVKPDPTEASSGAL